MAANKYTPAGILKRIVETCVAALCAPSSPIRKCGLVLCLLVIEKERVTNLNFGGAVESSRFIEK